MFTAFGWVVFGMAVWGLCIVMTALQRRFAPEMGDDGCASAAHQHPFGTKREPDPRDAEIAALRRRIETLEAIVTDRKYQWESEFDKAS